MKFFDCFEMCKKHANIKFKIQLLAMEVAAQGKTG